MLEKQYYYQSVLYVTVKKFRFAKKQEASELLSSLGIKTLLSITSLLGNILLYFESNSIEFNDFIVVMTILFKMNEVVNKNLIWRGKKLLKMH